MSTRHLRPTGAAPGRPGQSRRRVYPQTGHEAVPCSGCSSRKLVQPLVRQYSRIASERRRMRRIEAERPLMDDWWVRESMCSLGSFAAGLGRCEPWSAVELGSSRVGRSSECLCLLDAGASRTDLMFRSMLRPAVPSRHSPLTLLRMLCHPSTCQMVTQRDGAAIAAERALRRAAKVIRQRHGRAPAAHSRDLYHSRLLIEPEARLG